VRCHEHVIGLRPCRELLDVEDPSEVRDVGLDDVGGLAFEELAELIDAVEALPGRTGMPRGAIASAAFLRAARFSGGTGSSTQPGLKGASSRVISTAVAGLKRPCISTKIWTSSPTASRTASPSATTLFFSARSSS
jgi:hypothetical protein